MKNEIWKPVKGYENLYQVSSYGRVSGMGRVTSDGRLVKGKMLKPEKQGKGYFCVYLSKDGKRKCYLIHRLVAEAFIPNPNNHPCVNHKDEDKTNNVVENLEWCTHQYNNNYGGRNKKVAEKLSKPIQQFTLDGKFVKEYPSVREAGRQNNLHYQNIWKCLKGKYKHCGGYVWKYKEQG